MAMDSVKAKTQLGYQRRVVLVGHSLLIVTISLAVNSSRANSWTFTITGFCCTTSPVQFTSSGIPTCTTRSSGWHF